MEPDTGQHRLKSFRRQGARVCKDGTRFRVFSSCASAVELCLFDHDGREARKLHMAAEGDGDWSVFCPGISAGQCYGYRVHGPWSPDQGLRCNPAKLLIDPYARRISGAFHWAQAVFDYDPDHAHQRWHINNHDSAPYTPRSVVTTDAPSPGRAQLRQWSDSIIYEINVRGYTMQHPGLSKAERGLFSGMANGEIIAHLKALGISSVELMPVHRWLDEHHLAAHGLHNYWGYNPVSFFAADERLAQADPNSEFRAMVTALHEAGLEVILDVVYNHTGEGNELGPTLSLRGLDNLSYYRVEPGDAGVYINDTGCGNTLNADHPRVQTMVLESLKYWHNFMGVDGFRFDLAPVLGRRATGFDPQHELLRTISHCPELSTARLIAEPWDPGPGGYQLGQFPDGWAEWNDQYRDRVRRFWRGDPGQLKPLSQALNGSAEQFSGRDQQAASSVNFITSHDGFTLTDLVSYARRHNRANGEGNRDGHRHNLSVNHGVEGSSEDPVVLALRRRHRLNLIGTLLLSRGVPMILAGDELGNSQGGNNNAYAQDNETGWLNWQPRPTDDLREEISQLLQHRRWLLGSAGLAGGPAQDALQWFSPEGTEMSHEHWQEGRAALMDFTAGPNRPAALVAVNGNDHEQWFELPVEHSQWRLRWSSDGQLPGPVARRWRAAAWSITLLSQPFSMQGSSTVQATPD